MTNILRLLASMVILSGLILAGCDGGTEPQPSQPDGNPAAAAPKEGAPAPEFELLDLEGKTVSLSDYKGKPVMLNFWATWCTACMYEMPFFEEGYSEWTEQGLTLLAVNVGETPGKVQGFLQETGMQIPILLDTDQDAYSQYRIAAMPTTFFIDTAGVIQDVVIGAFPDKAAIDARLTQIMP